MLHLKHQHQHRNLYQLLFSLIPHQLVNNSLTVIQASSTSTARESWYGLIKAQPGAWPLYVSDRLLTRSLTTTCSLYHTLFGTVSLLRKAKKISDRG
jgi:hypothetical protein